MKNPGIDSLRMLPPTAAGTRERAEQPAADPTDRFQSGEGAPSGPAGGEPKGPASGATDPAVAVHGRAEPQISGHAAEQAPTALWMEDAPQADLDPDRIPTERLQVAALQARRRQLTPELIQLGRGLKARTIQGEDFGKAAFRIRDILFEADDPLLGRMARVLLYNEFRYKDVYQDGRFKMGDMGAAAYFLKDFAGRLSGWDAKERAYPKTFVEPILSLVHEAGEHEQAPIPMARDLLRTAHHLLARAETELKPEVREHESPEQNRRWGTACVQLLHRWMQFGDLLPTRNGSPVELTEDQLAEVLRQGVPSLTNEGVLDLTPAAPPPGHSKETAQAAEALSKNLADAWTRPHSEQLAERFEALLESKPGLARKTAAMLADQACERGERWGSTSPSAIVGAILQHGSSAAADLFRDRAGELAGQTARLEAAGKLGWNGSSGADGRAELYRGLLKAFPDLSSLKLVTEQLLPLVQNSLNCERQATGVILEQFERHPEWMGPVMDRFLQEPREFYLPKEQWPLIHGALERGWNPSPRQVDWLASWLYVPNADKDRDGLKSRGQDFQGAVKALSLLEKSHPGETARLEVPDQEGKPLPWKRAALDRILNDVNHDVRDFFAPEKEKHMLTMEGMRATYDAIFPDPEATDGLLASVEAGYAREGHLLKMSHPEQMALTVLGSIPLEPDQHERLRAIAQREYERDSGWYVHNDIVDVYRREYQQQQLAALGSPDSDLSTCVQACRDYCRCVVYRKSDYDLDFGTRPAIAGLKERLAKEGKLEDATRALLGEFLQEAGRADNVGEVSRPAGTALWVACRLASDDPALTQEFEVALRPFLTQKIEYGRTAVRAALEGPRNHEIERRMGLLSRQVGTHRELAESLSQINRMSAIRHYSDDPDFMDDAALKAWFEGSKSTASDWSGSLTRMYTDGALAWQAYQAVAAPGLPEAELERRFSEFKVVSRRLGGESHHADVVTGFQRFMEYQAEMPRDEALEKALRDYLHDASGLDLNAESGSAVREDQASVTLGGVRLKRRAEAPP